jgi:hypothetical protein
MAANGIAGSQALAAGNRTRKTEPRPSSDSTSISPP